MIDNKGADLYIKNKLMNDTVNLYCDKLVMIRSDLNIMLLRVAMQSNGSWSGVGRAGFEDAFEQWKELALEVLEDIEEHKEILDEMLIDSANLYGIEKYIAEDMD